MSKRSTAKNGTKKRAFTIRLEQEIIDKLEYVGGILNLKPSTVARSYLQLANLFIVTPATELMTYDNTNLAVLPKDFHKDMYNKLTEQQQYDFGDTIGNLINTNIFLLLSETTLELNDEQIKELKLKMVSGLGWAEIREYRGVWGISKRDLPWRIVEAMVYRLVENRKFPTDRYNDSTVFQYMHDHSKIEKLRDSKSTRKDADEIEKRIKEYKESLGVFDENIFNQDVPYYLYSKLTVYKPPLPPKSQKPTLCQRNRSIQGYILYILLLLLSRLNKSRIIH